MNDPYGILPTPASPVERQAEFARRNLLRRLGALLVAGSVAFTLTTWTLVRLENPMRYLPFGPGPASVVRQHLEALNRGELRAAYDLFSAEYRAHVPFEAYHQLVITHREIFRTREVRFGSPTTLRQRTVVETHLLAADGEHYVARFTLLRAEGRWWIDDLRWGADRSQRFRIEI